MLTGEAKRRYQREYMRSYMRERRALGLKFPYQTKSSPSKGRFEILKRDGFRCQYCGSTAKDGVKLEIDHIRPVCKGGTDEESNLITACLQCNRSKGGQLFDYDTEQTVMSRVLTIQDADDFRPQFDADGNEMPEYA